MADQTQTVDNGGEAPPANGPAPAAPASVAGDHYTGDPSVPDRSDQLMEVFGLEGDWEGALDASIAKLSSAAADGVGAPPPPAAPAAEGEPGASVPAPATPAAPTAGAPPTPQSEPAAPAAAPAASAPAAPDNELATLKAQVQALSQQLAATQAAPQASQAAPAASPPTSEQTLTPEKLLDYSSVAIHPSVFQAMESDDPTQRQAALHHIIQSTAKLAHERVMAHVDIILGERLQEFGQTQQVNSQQKQMLEDYYGAFPDHNDPLNRLIVAQEAQAMFTENPTLGWSNETRNALGARVNAKLGKVAAPAEPDPNPAQPQPATPAPAKPAAMTGATTRPAQNGNGKSGAEEMLDILSSF